MLASLFLWGSRGQFNRWLLLLPVSVLFFVETGLASGQEVITYRVSQVHSVLKGNNKKSVQQFFYNSNGQLKQVAVTSGDKTEYVTTHFYNADGMRVRSEKDNGGNGNVDMKVTYEYDSGGQLQKVRIKFYKEGKENLVLVGVYSYEDGRVISKVTYVGNNNVDGREIRYEYDSAGKLVTQTARTFTLDYKYDDTGRLKLVELNRRNNIEKVDTYFYEKGRCKTPHPESIKQFWCVAR